MLHASHTRSHVIVATRCARALRSCLAPRACAWCVVVLVVLLCVVLCCVVLCRVVLYCVVVLGVVNVLPVIVEYSAVLEDKVEIEPS
jgi:multisubunit Na+/H+ antiporter MnhE subunit